MSDIYEPMTFTPEQVEEIKRRVMASIPAKPPKRTPRDTVREVEKLAALVEPLEDLIEAAVFAGKTLSKGVWVDKTLNTVLIPGLIRSIDAARVALRRLEQTDE